MGQLVDGLRKRRPEIEEAILARVYAVDSGQEGDPDYILGLKTAVRAGIAYGLSQVEEEKAWITRIPGELLSQARRAAGLGVSLDTVLRRYVAGHALLNDFIVQEVDAAGMSRAFAQFALRRQAVLLDDLIDGIAAEFRSEIEAGSRTARHWRAECVRRLLAGELSVASELDYELDGWHLGVTAYGEPAEAMLRALVERVAPRSLVVPGAEGIVWAWLGGARRHGAEELEALVSQVIPSSVRAAIGEPGQGFAGWRLTHNQAVAALPVARCRSRAVTRYADVALLASIHQDEVLVKSLRQLYLTPLASERDGGKALRSTLRAYFEAERNSASAASILGVTRQTVSRRLRLVEELLGRPLGCCATELEAALSLEELDDLESTS